MINFNIEEIAFEYQRTHESLTKLAKKYSTTRQTLARYFKKMGIEVINRLNITKFNEHVFDSIDTEEKAYWLGFIFADGTIDSSPLNPEVKSRYEFELSLKGSDKNHLDKFNIFMEHIDSNHVSIGKTICTSQGKRIECQRCRWMVANKHLWTILNSYGCTPKKSLTLQFPEENIFKDKSLIRHFIRGYFDGDGCLTRYIYHTIVSPRVELLGTKDFLQSILVLSGIDASYKHDSRHTENTWSLNYNKENSILFINYLYLGAKVYLDRKYRLYEFFKNGSRSVEEFTELQQTNIGESPKEDNPEVTTEPKESAAPLSVETEPVKTE